MKEDAGHVGYLQINGKNGSTRSIKAGPPGFEPGSEAPEAPIISMLYHRPVVGVWFRKGSGLAVDEPAILTAPVEREGPKWR